MRTEEMLNEFYESGSQVYKKSTINDVSNLIDSLISEVEKGNQNALDVFISFKQIADHLDSAKKKIDELAIKEMSAYTDGFYNGNKIMIVEGRKSFNFKGIKEIEEKEKELKELQNIYKCAYDGVQKGIVHTDNGEWIDNNGELKPLPIPVYGKTYLKLEKAK